MHVFIWMDGYILKLIFCTLLYCIKYFCLPDSYHTLTRPDGELSTAVLGEAGTKSIARQVRVAVQKPSEDADIPVAFTRLLGQIQNLVFRVKIFLYVSMYVCMVLFHVQLLRIFLCIYHMYL